MSAHVFDEAIALTPMGEHQWAGNTHPAYANMVGPFGGITTAQVVAAMLQHPQRLGDPIALTVNFCAAVADGAFTISAIPVRTNRSTQHWTLAMTQGGETVFTGTAVTAVRRATWSLDEEAMPQCPPPTEVPVPERVAPMEFVKRYEQRVIAGPLPQVWDGSGDSSLSQLWVRDKPPRPLDFVSLAAISDIFYPRVFVRRSTHVPAGTVTLTTYFHVNAAEIAQVGDAYLLGQARAQAFRNGFFDQTAQLWSPAGVMLVSTHQLVYYKQ